MTRYGKDSWQVAGLVALLFALCFAPGWPQAAEISWQAPTEFENGYPLIPAEDLSEFRLYCDGVQLRTFGADARSADVPFKPGSSNPCHMTAVAVDGSESAASNEVVFTEAPAAPAAPTLLIP